MGTFRRIFDAVAIFVGSALLLAIVLPVAYVVYSYHAPHLLLNGTTRYLSQYRELRDREDNTSLIPGLFAGGEQKQEVESQLLNAGLDSWKTTRTDLPPGAATTQLFHLWAGGRDLACGSELFVRLGYDGDDKLVSATVRQGGACL